MRWALPCLGRCLDATTQERVSEAPRWYRFRYGEIRVYVGITTFTVCITHKNWIPSVVVFINITRSLSPMLIGTTLRSRYKIIKKLGSGGLGDTYLAQDIDLPGKPYCVVKHLSPKNTNPRFLPIAQKLFEREAKILYRLGEHNQIPRLYAHFDEADNFYLVQEFVDGHDLSAEITVGSQLTEVQTVKLLQEILEVLVFVHQQGIIHRDIKPQNIMRRKQDEKLVLIDFGAVKEISTISINSQYQTSSTVAIGTPGYMANEQLSGHPKLCSDIYAVGMIGIQALTGILPRLLPRDSNTLEVIWCDNIPVSNGLERILNRMVRYHFSLRYQNVSELLQALISLQVQGIYPSQNATYSIPLFSNNWVSPWLQPTEKIDSSNLLDSNITRDEEVRHLNQKSIAQSKVEKQNKALEVELYSSSCVDYTPLHDLLKAQKWEEADKETTLLVLKAANRESDGWLQVEDIKKLKREDLGTIDQLWVAYSNGRFGFSVQKQLFKSLGGTRDYDPKIWEILGEHVGWILEGKCLRYRSLSFDLNAKVGCFPTFLGRVRGCRVGVGGAYFLELVD
jgi:eukaryotic-like serine/threonine-protein kinase